MAARPRRGPWPGPRGRPEADPSRAPHDPSAGRVGRCGVDPRRLERRRVDPDRVPVDAAARSRADREERRPDPARRGTAPGPMVLIPAPALGPAPGGQGAGFRGDPLRRFLRARRAAKVRRPRAALPQAREMAVRIGPARKHEAPVRSTRAAPGALPRALARVADEHDLSVPDEDGALHGPRPGGDVDGRPFQEQTGIGEAGAAQHCQDQEGEAGHRAILVESREFSLPTARLSTPQLSTLDCPFDAGAGASDRRTAACRRRNRRRPRAPGRRVSSTACPGPRR